MRRLISAIIMGCFLAIGLAYGDQIRAFHTMEIPSKRYGSIHVFLPEQVPDFGKLEGVKNAYHYKGNICILQNIVGQDTYQLYVVCDRPVTLGLVVWHGQVKRYWSYAYPYLLPYEVGKTQFEKHIEQQISAFEAFPDFGIATTAL